MEEKLIFEIPKRGHVRTDTAVVMRVNGKMHNMIMDIQKEHRKRGVLEKDIPTAADITKKMAEFLEGAIEYERV